MNQKEIVIERVKVKDLYPFAANMIAEAEAGQFIPISKQRALALENNPNADQDDIGLLVAYYGEACVGYFGIMAVMLRIGDEQSKVHWFTTWSVSPKMRGKRVGTKLMEEALKIENDYMIVGSAPARHVSHKFGFHDFPPFNYYKINFRVAGRLNPVTLLLRVLRKGLHVMGVNMDISRVNRTVARIFDRLLSPIIQPYLQKKVLGIYRNHLHGVKAKQVDKVRSPEKEKVNHQGIGFYRSTSVINWMLKYPWVLESGQSESEHMEYSFSDTRPLFEFVAYEVYDSVDDIYKGYFVFSFSQIREKMIIRVLDYDFMDREDEKLVLPLVLEYGVNHKVDEIDIPLHLVDALVNTTVGRLTLQRKKRIYQCHPRSETSPLGKYWQDIELNFCDGDIPFT
jgi:predicted N-acetyltransferase YhbS